MRSISKCSIVEGHYLLLVRTVSKSLSAGVLGKTKRAASLQSITPAVCHSAGDGGCRPNICLWCGTEQKIGRLTMWVTKILESPSNHSAIQNVIDYT